MSNHVALTRRPRRALILTAALIAALPLAACGGKSGESGDGKITLSFAWWGDATRAKSTQNAVALFEKQHPTIKVSTQYATFGPYNQKLATQIAGGGAPDLMQIDWGNQSQYARSNTLMDLATGPAQVDISGLDPKFSASGQTGGKQVAVPVGQTAQSIVVNETKLDSLGVPVPKAGWTWDDVARFGAEVHGKSKGKVAGIADPGTTWAAFQSWLAQRGKPMYGP